ncbi:nucleotidyltransferase domain-containing protein [Dongia deserti]|uniref:nucleotidyltransferase domain-containing protein n=1 Tax=Dongia deserti TaxID=2268030 RepID=UPI000E6587D8|nr:nucleotidyltransferase domain-containing protein [Dongia deserti]
MKNAQSRELAQHESLLARIADVTRRDPRLIGLLVGGSHVSGTTDRYSDLDCILVAEAESYASVLEDRRAMADRVAPLLHAFTGEHVGEPRLMICLYETPPLHVDYKVLTLEALKERVEDPIVVWARDDSIRGLFERSAPHWPRQLPEWFEERFWIWVHYAAMKVGRGEIFEGLDMFALLRRRVFGPLLAERAGHRQYEVRHIERLVPEAIPLLAALTPPPDRAACATALVRAMDVYLDLTRTTVPSNRNPAAEITVRRYLAEAIV